MPTMIDNPHRFFMLPARIYYRKLNCRKHRFDRFSGSWERYRPAVNKASRRRILPVASHQNEVAGARAASETV